MSGTFRAVSAVLLLLLSFLLSGLTWPQPPEKPRIEYLYSFSIPEDLKIEKAGGEKILNFIFGKSKADEDRISRPQGIFSQGGRTLVADTLRGCVHVFDEKQKQYFKIKKAGLDLLVSPVAAAADQTGKIYVSDSRLNKVFVFDPRGNYLSELGEGKLMRPAGIAIDDLFGRIYVVDTLAGDIKVFNFNGWLLLSFGKFNHPTYIAVGKDGGIFVVDALNFMVRQFSKEGRLKRSFGRMGRTPGSFSQPKGIALDSEQNIYVTDSSFDNVQIFNTDGKLLLFFGESGGQSGEFWLPAGISIDEQDTIRVADSYNGRVQVFRYLK